MINLFGSTSPIQSDITLQDQFLGPVFRIAEDFTRTGRECSGISDPDFIRFGVTRVLSQVQSGRDFIQHTNELFGDELARATFFKSLHSSRRSEFIEEVSWGVYCHGRGQMLYNGADLLGAFPELRDRAVWAGDGHKIEHACHALKDAKGRFVPPNTIYLLCLHSSMLFSLGAIQGDGHYQHEMKAFRRAIPDFLRKEFGGDGRSRRHRHPLFVLDPGFINNHFWTQHKLIRQIGARLVIRPKSTMAPKKWEERDFDRNDPVNLGVDSDQNVTFEGNLRMRLIRFTDPETKVCYQFLTTDFDLRPGVIAWLYLMRWRIEKVFDTSKNKLEETKAWATGRVAANIQAHFLAITHNLLVLFREFLGWEHGIEEEKLKDRRAEHLKRRAENAKNQGCQLHPLHREMPLVVQMSVQFIRTLRNQIAKDVSLTESLPRFRDALAAYL